MFQFVIKEDTFTPWAEKKISTVDALQRELLIFLKNLFLGHMSEEELVPHLSGELEESAYDSWEFVGGLEAMSMLITWSGENNPNESEWEYFVNTEHEDYALANYRGFHWQTMTYQPKNFWVGTGIIEVFVSGEGFDKIGKEYLRWLLE